MSLSQFATCTPQVEYALGHSSRELDRLSFQGTVCAPFTRQLFTQAGIVSGMRVLDVGSRSGDVSFLAVELVGESGHVLGVDRFSGSSGEGKSACNSPQPSQRCFCRR
jgi:ubiquinone/menaquinone biosynthesis C-methylase UbiE